jgi:membrane associated rhomboid family serine protease
MMIPLRDENPTRTVPFITVAIIIVNALVFFYELQLGAYLEGFVRVFGMVPNNLMHLREPSALITLVTSMFVHGSIVHLFGNMLYLWIFGNNIEDRLGHLRFVFFYLLCGLAGSLGHIASSPYSTVPTIGASGAISGILGAYLVVYPRAKIQTLFFIVFFVRLITIDARWFLLVWIAFQLVSGVSSYTLAGSGAQDGVAWFAHCAGFFAGAIGVFLLAPPRLQREK